MLEINTISPERMNGGAHFMFMTNVVKKAAADTTVKTRAASQLATLQAALEAEDAALKVSQKSLLSDDIAAADRLRDQLYRSYRKAVSGFIGFPVKAQADAAKVLSQHIKDYGIDPKDQLDKETGLLINFITDLEGKYNAQISTLGLTAFVSQLKAANQSVATLVASRTNERIPHVVGALRLARLATDEAYRMFIRMVNALSVVEGEADYAAFIDYMNTEIVHYKREVIGQKATDTGHGATLPDDDTDGETPDPAV